MLDTLERDDNHTDSRPLLISRLLTYSTDAAASHLTNAYWHLDNCELQACDPTKHESTNKSFIARGTESINERRFNYLAGYTVIFAMSFPVCSRASSYR